MKKLILLLFIPLVSYGQSIENLDKKNGFKSLKINSDKSTLKKFLSGSDVAGKDGYTTYQLIDIVEYSTEFVERNLCKRCAINPVISQYYVDSKYGLFAVNLYELKKHNPNLKYRWNRQNILISTKNQKIKIPSAKLSKREVFDDDTNTIFDYKVFNKVLTYDSNDKLKRINLKIYSDSDKIDINYISLMGYKLKEFYYKFFEIIGPTTDYNKPTSDCELYKNETCKYFEERALDGSILWKSDKIVLKLSQKVFLDKSDINKFSWMQEIIFYSRDYYDYLVNSSF